MTGLVQGFYGWRIYQLSRNAYVPFAIGVLLIVKFGANLVVIVWAGRGSTVKHVWLDSLCLAADVALDSGIAVCMTLWLYRYRTGFKSTNTALKRMVKYSICTGLLTSIVSVISFVLFIVGGTTVQGLAVFALNNRLHAMALLGNLHMRSSFKELDRGVESLYVPLSLIQRINSQVLRRGSISGPPSTSVVDGVQVAEDHQILRIQ